LLTSSGFRARAAFTVVEAIVGLAVVAVVAAIVVVTTSDTRRASRVTADIKVLRELTEALNKFDTGVTVFPLSLLHLTTRPLATNFDSCGNAIGAANVTNWANTGPFYSQPIIGPIPLEVGTVSTSLVRVGPTLPATTAAAVLQISVTSVSLDDAVEINTQVDNDPLVGSASATGVVRFPNPFLGTFTWNVAVRGC
jgi:type II secretory pathway pseudopilin PulG